jgi:predicted AlkP superfamily phosphohydrolase/phosphomutase
MQYLRFVGLAGALTLSATTASAWGFIGHRLINARAVESLPEPLRSLFEANADYLAEHSIDPDLWRWSGKPGEHPNHFLDADAFGTQPFASIPSDEAEHYRRHGDKAVEYGRAPWRIAEEYDALVGAFAARDAAAALRHAAILGHYVADIHVPLHAALNYDGQLTGQRGLHSRWESQLVGRYHNEISSDVHPRQVEFQPDAESGAETYPVELALDVVRESFAELEALLVSDREATTARDDEHTPPDERYDDAYFERFYAREGARVRRRMTRASECLGALWLGAWREADRPALEPFRFAYVRGQRRAVLLSLDGGGETPLRAAIARGAMPEFARLRALGATAQGVISTFPAKTAPGHAALMTGAWSDRNGVAGNMTSIPGGSPLAAERGFQSDHLTAEPFWVTAAREGLDAVVASGTQTFPFAPFFDEKRFGGDYGRTLSIFDGYGAPQGRETVVTGADIELRPAQDWGQQVPEGAREIELTLAGVRFFGLYIDDPTNAVAGFDSLFLAPERDLENAARLTAAAAGSGPNAFVGVRLPGAEERFIQVRLFELSADGAQLLLYATLPYTLRASRAELAEGALEYTGGFVGNGASWAYGAGAFGPTLGQGGDGIAEERYLETVALVIERFARLNAFCLEQDGWDLLVTYLPYPDEVFHVWLGALEPTLPGYDADLANRLRPFLDRALRLVDDEIARLAAAIGPSSLFAIASDHGQIGVNRRILPNTILANAGLLFQDASGGIDLARTRAVYHPSNSGFLLINSEDRGGPVGVAEAEQVRRDVILALRGARDPKTGQPVILDVIDARQGGTVPRVGGVRGGDLYIVAAPGYYASARVGAAAAESMAPQGVHLFGPDRSEMHSSFTVSGPGVQSGARLGVISQIDIAPTLSALLGLAPPAQAEGRVVEGALVQPDAR